MIPIQDLKERKSKVLDPKCVKVGPLSLIVYMKPMDDRKRETAAGNKNRARSEPRGAGKATLGREPKKRMLL